MKANQWATLKNSKKSAFTTPLSPHPVSEVRSRPSRRNLMFFLTSIPSSLAPPTQSLGASSLPPGAIVLRGPTLFISVALAPGSMPSQGQTSVYLARLNCIKSNRIPFWVSAFRRVGGIAHALLPFSLTHKCSFLSTANSDLEAIA